MRMNLDDQTVSTDGDRAFGGWTYQTATSGGVRRVYDDRQMTQLIQQRDCSQVQRISRGGLERSNSSLAKNNLIVAVRRDVLGRQKKFLDRRAHPSLQKNWAIGAAQSLQQCKVLHVASANLKNVGVFGYDFSVFGSHDFGDDLEAGAITSFGQQLQSFDLQPLKIIRRRPRFVSSATQHLSARLLDRVC